MKRLKTNQTKVKSFKAIVSRCVDMISPKCCDPFFFANSNRALYKRMFMNWNTEMQARWSLRGTELMVEDATAHPLIFPNFHPVGRLAPGASTSTLSSINLLASKQGIPLRFILWCKCGLVVLGDTLKWERRHMYSLHFHIIFLKETSWKLD